MDGQNNGSRPYEQMDDLGGFPIIFGSTPMSLIQVYIGICVICWGDSLRHPGPPPEVRYDGGAPKTIPKTIKHRTSRGYDWMSRWL